MSVQAVNGILLLDKPLGLSSNQALQKAKRLLNAKKAGHTGSLDPLATGMLPICFGEATKFSQYLLDADKAYQTTGVLGVTTTTGDSEGAVVHQVDALPQIPQADLERVLNQLRGSIAQTPPMYSALKHQGKPLYTYARRGEVIERKPRHVEIKSLKCSHFDGKSFDLSVTCSKGTYIRSLVESVGEALGVGAHVTKLHRVYTAGFETSPMISLESLAELTPESRCELLLPVDAAVVSIPKLDVSVIEAEALKKGQKPSGAYAISGLVRLYHANYFLGLGEVDARKSMLSVKRLIAN